MLNLDLDVLNVKMKVEDESLYVQHSICDLAGGSTLIKL